MASPMSNAAPACPRCSGTGWRPDETGDAVVPCECRTGTRLERALAAAQIPPRYRDCAFTNFELYPPRGGPRNESLWKTFGIVQGYLADYPLVEGTGLLLIGDTGVGKTHLAAALLKALIDKGAEGLFLDYQELLKRIQSSYNPKALTAEREVIRPVLETEVVVIDDLGANRISEWVEDTINYLLNHRYNEKKPHAADRQLEPRRPQRCAWQPHRPHHVRRAAGTAGDLAAARDVPPGGNRRRGLSKARPMNPRRLVLFLLCLLLLLFAVPRIPSQQPAGMWAPRSPMPIALSEVGTAAVGGKIYVVGGLTGTAAPSTALQIYDPFLDRWSLGPPLPLEGGVDHPNVAAAAGKLYVLGGLAIVQGRAIARTFEFDPATESWTEKAPMPRARGAAGTAELGGKIYVAGGQRGSLTVSEFAVFDPATNTWMELPPMPTPRNHLTAQALGGEFYAIGGRPAAERSGGGVRPGVEHLDRACLNVHPPQRDRFRHAARADPGAGRRNFHPTRWNVSGKRGVRSGRRYLAAAGAAAHTATRLLRSGPEPAAVRPRRRHTRRAVHLRGQRGVLLPARSAAGGDRGRPGGRCCLSAPPGRRGVGLPVWHGAGRRACPGLAIPLARFPV